MQHTAWGGYDSLCQLHVRKYREEKEDFVPRGNKESKPSSSAMRTCAQRDLVRKYHWLRFLYEADSKATAGVIDDIRVRITIVSTAQFLESSHHCEQSRDLFFKDNL